METITSTENPLIKTIRDLKTRTSRRAAGRFLVEGIKLVQDALASGIKIEHVLVSTLFAQSDVGSSLTARLEEEGIRWVAASHRVFRRASSLETPEGILLVARIASRDLASLAGDLVLVVAGVQDPGNLGAIARVAEAARASALVKCRGSADPFQPKALRASMGSLIRLPVFVAGEPPSVLETLRNKGFRLGACLPRHGVDFRRVNLRGRLALVVGSESSGLPKELIERSDVRISVPMNETVESLNVAVVTGLVLYEAARQRGTL